MEEPIHSDVLSAVIKHIISNAGITDKLIIDTFALGFIAGVRFVENSQAQ